MEEEGGARLGGREGKSGWRTRGQRSAAASSFRVFFLLPASLDARQIRVARPGKGRAGEASLPPSLPEKRSFPASSPPPSFDSVGGDVRYRLSPYVKKLPTSE